MGKAEVLRAAGYVGGEFQVIELSDGRITMVRSIGQNVSFDAPPGDVVLLGAGPTVVMSDGSALIWRDDLKRWKPFGNLRDPARTIDRRAREVEVRVESPSTHEWGPSVRLKAIRRFEYLDGIYAERADLVVTEREAFSLVLGGYAVRLDRPADYPAWIHVSDWDERCKRAPKVSAVSFNSFGGGPEIGMVVRGQMLALPYPRAMGLEHQGAVRIIRPGDRVFVNGELVEAVKETAATVTK